MLGSLSLLRLVLGTALCGEVVAIDVRGEATASDLQQGLLNEQFLLSAKAPVLQPVGAFMARYEKKKRPQWSCSAQISETFSYLVVDVVKDPDSQVGVESFEFQLDECTGLGTAAPTFVKALAATAPQAQALPASVSHVIGRRKIYQAHWSEPEVKFYLASLCSDAKCTQCVPMWNTSDPRLGSLDEQVDEQAHTSGSIAELSPATQFRTIAAPSHASRSVCSGCGPAGVASRISMRLEEKKIKYADVCPQVFAGFAGLILLVPATLCCQRVLGRGDFDNA